MARDQQTVEVDGHRLRVSSLDKVMYPSTGTTKGEVMQYYAEIAGVMLPHCRDRAATRKRWVNGVGTAKKPGEMFFQKDLGDGAPDWLATAEIEHRDHSNTYPLVNDAASLAWLAQLAALEIHVPQWRFGSDGERLNPDRLVIDLDPGEGVSLRDCAGVARLARDILKDAGLLSVPVTSGSKGIHLYAALDGGVTSEQASKLAKELATSLEADHPDTIISSMRRSSRAGRVFMDWSQNNAAKTTVAPYSLRGRLRPTVAAPRTWGELASPQLKQLEFGEVLRRVAKRGDPLADLAGGRPGPSGAEQRLQRYREMRDPARTSEPMGAERESAGNVFVIQRHAASSLHFDFRLEHEGVLVSWALPKGVPSSGSTNHLAVPTEDHPLDYRFFEGEIPKGEYGAGSVTIWDSGRYELEKWRRVEVIVVLHGDRGGGLGGQPTRLALFRTGGTEQKPTWMIHRMDAARSARHPRAGNASKGSSKPASRLPSPMLATSSSLPEVAARAEEFALEMKWDGMRAIARADDTGVRLASRSGRDVSDEYPELAALGECLNADDVVVDGEIVAFDRHGRPDFSRLQRRMGMSDAREIAATGIRTTLVLFDLLRVNGESCTKLPYVQRRALLREAIDESRSPRVRIPEAFEGDLDAAVATSERLGLEGVMAKRLDSSYTPGVRSRSWLKLPRILTREVLVVGWRPRGENPRLMASLLLATPDGDGLRYLGRVGTGFSDRDRRGLVSGLPGRATAPSIEGLPSADAADAHWLRPDRVAEVSYRDLTGEGRLRHAVWRGWRPDKSPQEITR